jgi:hypothetical protein
MAITNLDSLQRRQEMNDRIRARQNRLNPLFGQQQQGNSYSIPMGGNSFMRGNQIGGASKINIYRAPQPELTPEELEAQQLEERAAQYQQNVAEFNLGQREAELEKQRAEAEEIASGRFMIDGRAVTRAEMDQYQRGVKESGAKAQADFNRENPFYAAAKAAMPQAPQPDQFSNDADYQSAIKEYATDASEQAREQQFNQSLNELRRNALTKSINQFRDDPMSYLMGGGREGSSTYSPDALMGYLGQASQLFKATGQEGNFMDFMLGNTSTPAQASGLPPAFTASDALKRQYGSPQQSSVMPSQRAYVPGTSYAMQGFQAPQSDNPPAFYSMPKRNSRQQPAPRRTGTMGFAGGGGGGGGYSGIAATNARFLGL